jgi:para-aminobenzoate synthetase/4-amino-4-deoxychorismate lyase
MAPGRRARFSVAIRTLVVDTARGAATYGVGSGIVWDSSAEAEHAECRLKARVLEAQPADFELLETLRWAPDDGFARLDRHLARLAASARYFGFRVDDWRVRAELARAVTSCPAEPHRVRLLVGRRGEVRVEAHVLGPYPDTERLALAPTPVDPCDAFLFHKTTRRDAYDAALRACPGAGDVLLWNTRGEITETCRANVAVLLDGSLVTPPVACGLLGGTLRNELIDEGTLRERVVTRGDLARAGAVFVISSLRGLRRAEVDPPCG